MVLGRGSAGAQETQDGAFSSRPLDEPLFNLCIDLMEPLFGAICLVPVKLNLGL